TRAPAAVPRTVPPLSRGLPPPAGGAPARASRASLALLPPLPLMANSDHANFAAHGIPALRLIAGFGSPDSHLRLLLTAADTRDKVRRDELDAALRLALVLTREALRLDEATLGAFAQKSG